MSEYTTLETKLLAESTGDLLPQVPWSDPEKVEQRIAVLVCEYTGMTPERWDRLNEKQRIPWLDKALKNLKKKAQQPNVWLEGSDMPEYLSEEEILPSGNSKAEGSRQDVTIPKPATRTKRSTSKGEAREKIIAALTKHHQYEAGSCLISEPIGNNELARNADVSSSTASRYFVENFGSYDDYRGLCKNVGNLCDSLKLLRGEFKPKVFVPQPRNKRKQHEDD
jgi:hypothetical protein